MKINKLLIVSIFLMLVVLLSACNKGQDQNENVDDVTTPVQDVTTPVEEEVINHILTADIGKYFVIRAEECDARVISAVSELYGEMRQKYGDGMTLKTDFVLPNNDKYAVHEYEILIGETNREESVKYFDTLRYNDYGYTLMGNKIVIAGGSDEATILAVEKFANDIVAKKDANAEVFFDISESYLYKAEYDVESFVLNGAPINEYKIVYKNSGVHHERELASSLRNVITNVTGYTLDVMSDKQEYEGGCEILIGVTNRDASVLYGKNIGDEGYYIGSTEKFVGIWGATPLATMSAVNDFNKMISSYVGSVKDVVMNIDETYGIIQEGSELRAMSFNVWVSSRSDARDDRVVQMVLNYMPDVVGFQETSAPWMSVLIQRLGNEYAYVGEGRNGGGSGEYNPIFYRKDKFELLESGTKWLSDTPDVVSKYSDSAYHRIFTYAKLRRLSDGMEFLHINTHLDHPGDASAVREKQAKVIVKFMAKNIGVPMILTGDFNCTSGTAEYKVITNSGVVSSSDVAEQKETIGTFHDYGSSSRIIDFIFVDPTNIYVKKYDVCDERIDGNYASDHHPVCIDFYIIH